jgi:pimeloyl-[acyl-carrier protein] methyl ester esterase
MLITPAKIHIEVIGTGPNLVLIHGWGMNGSVWHPLVKRLSKNFTLHIVDLPGMGFSQIISPYHLYSIAEKIAELLPNNTAMLGWSLGGQVAMRIALDQPEVVNKLILVGSTPCFVNVSGLSAQSHWQFGIEAATFEKFSKNVAQDYQKTMMQFLSLQCMGSKSSMFTLRALKNKFAERPAPTQQLLQDALNILLNTDLRREIANIAQPTLVIHGDKDALAPVQAANWLRQHLPVAFLRVISGASHAPFLSHTDAFIDALEDFLLTQKASA